ncbi:hypothetical protein BGZ58_006522 [Dissophora ornata]|nr:hypothetical protein BGZ58_006522 [Dissophora ornata]
MSRIHSRLAIVAFAALAALASIAAQGDTPAQYDCGNISVDGNIYDISALKPTTFTITGEPKVEHPSKIRVDYKLNPCQAIVVPDGGENTNCKAGAWVCQETKVIPAEGDPQTIFLRTIAGSAPAADGTPAREVAPSVARAEKLEDVKELPWNLTLKGGNIDGQDQSAVITFICDMAILPVAEEGMGGFSIFLTVLAVFGLVYVVAGAVYKHKVYHATGLDLLPNIDFWRDFPGLVMDVTRHVWESVTGRHTSGHGYVSV